MTEPALPKDPLFGGDVQPLLDHRGEFNDDRGEDDADHRHDERRAGGVFAGIANGVAADAGLMGFGAFTVVRAILDILLRIVPRAACIVEHGASTKPQPSPPVSSPITPGTPRIRPVTTGTMIASSDGTSISFCAPLVEMATQLA